MAVMMLRGSHRLAVSLALFLATVILSYPAFAENGRATTMWGTGSDGAASSSKSKSSEFHASGGIIAGQVNAARLGVLYSGPNMTVVGSQTVLQVTGNNNVVKDIDQNAINSGDQSLEASMD